jgi:hypothetical protein
MSGEDKWKFGKMKKMLKKPEWRGEKQQRRMVVARKDNSHLNKIGVLHMGIGVVVIKAGTCREVALIVELASCQLPRWRKERTNASVKPLVSAKTGTWRELHSIVNYKRRNARLVLQNKKRGKRQKKRRTESARGNRRGKRNWPSKRSPSPKRRANHAVALASAGAVPLRRVVAAAAIAALQIVDHHPPVVARLTLPVPGAVREAGVGPTTGVVVRVSNALQAQAASRPTQKVEVAPKAWTEIGKVVGIGRGRRNPDPDLILEIERKAVKPKRRRKRKCLVLQRPLHWKRAAVIARPLESKTVLAVPRNEHAQSQAAGIVVKSIAIGFTWSRPTQGTNKLEIRQSF